MGSQVSEVKQAYPGVPVLDEDQKSELQAAFLSVVEKARSEALPKSRWESYQDEKNARSSGSVRDRDPRAPEDYITSTHKWFEQHGDDGVKGLTTSQFSRAHEALRGQDGVGEILYGGADHKLYDSDLFFALKQIYVELEYPKPRR